MTVVIAGALTAGVDAAQVEIISRIGTTCPVIRVKGDFIKTDAEKFELLVRPFKRALVEFESDGGTAYDGLIIGKIIFGSGYWTVVRAGKRCASACAIAWLGGTHRFAEKGSRIGFHAVYIKKNKRTEESGIGNAILGAYLTKLGLSEDAVAYVTASGPAQMAWLTPKAARDVGIEVTFGRPIDNQHSSPDRDRVSTGFSAASKYPTKVTSNSASHVKNGTSTKQIYDRLTPEQEEDQKKSIDDCFGK